MKLARDVAIGSNACSLSSSRRPNKDDRARATGSALAVLDFIDANVGRLVVVTIVVAALVAMATTFVPSILGFDWLGPLRVLRNVAVRSGFPTEIAVAWALGRLSNVPRGELRLGLQTLIARLPTLYREPRALERAGRGLALALLLGLAFPTYHLVDLASIALVAASTGPSSRGLRANASDAARAAVLFVASSYAFTVVKSLLFVVSEPKDASILALETSLFGRPIHHYVVGWVTSNPRLADVFDDLYFRLFEHMTIASVFLAAAGRVRERAKLWSSLTLCYLIGGPAYYLLPGLGPAFFEAELYRPIAERGLLSREVWDVLLANTNAMRDKLPIELTAYSFIACMPSLHLAHEVVMLYYARFSRPFFLLSLAFTTATSVAVMALGWHYFVDIFGGVALGALAIALVERFGPGLPTPSTTSTPAVPHSAEEAPDDALAPAEAASARASSPRRFAPWLPFVFLLGPVALLCLSVFSPVVLEDLGRIGRPPTFLTFRGLANALTSPATSVVFPLEASRFYRPLEEALDWLLLLGLGGEPRAHHVAGLLLLGTCAWLGHRAAERLEAPAVLRWCVAIAIVLHPATVFAAAYVSNRVWLVGGAVVLLLLLRLVDEQRTKRLFLTTFVGSTALGLLHEGMTFAGLALPLVVPPSPRAQREASAVAAALGCTVTLGLRRLVLGDSPFGGSTWLKEWLGSLPAAVGSLVRAVFFDFTPSPASAQTIGTTPSDVVLGAVILAAMIGGWVWSLKRVTTDRGRLIASSVALALGATLAIASSAASRRGFPSAGVTLAVIGIALAVSGWLARSGARLLQKIGLPTGSDAALRRASPLAPTVMLLVGLPLAWNGLFAMRDVEHLAETIFNARPDDPRRALLAGSVFLQRQKPVEARALCERALTLTVHPDDVSYCLARALAELGDTEGASKRLEAVLPRLEGSADLRALYTLTLANRGDVERAMSEASRLLERYPDDAQLGRILQALREGKPSTVEEPPAPKSKTHFGPSRVR